MTTDLTVVARQSQTLVAWQPDELEMALFDAVASDVYRLTEASRYTIGAGGKRLRPRIVLLAYRAVGGQNVDEATPLAVAVELIHTATLVHDDINDRSPLRRGQPTVGARWGNTTALLTGDFLFVRALRLMPGYDERILRALAEACVALVEGETLQLLTLGDLKLSEEVYFQILSKKTAALFSAAAEMGAIQGGGGETEVEALRQYGFNLGIAFQIADDVLDVVGDPAKMGKPVGSDLAQSKPDLITIHVAQQGTAKEALATGDVAGLMDQLRQRGVAEYALSKAREYAQRAKDNLSLLTPSPERQTLLALADAAAHRDG